jgi:SAM-dependent methyltransferase
MSTMHDGGSAIYSAKARGGAQTLCPVCGAASAMNLGKWAGEYDRLRCWDCGLIYADPLRGVPNTYEQQYAETGAYRMYIEAARKVKAGKAALGWPYRVLLERLEALPPGSRLFEVGCGVGYFLYYLRQRGWKAAGCDVDLSAVQSAKDVLGLEVGHADLRAATVTNGSQDVLVAFEVIEHLENPVAFLRLAAAKLRAGGYLFLSTPNSSTKWPLRWSREKEVLPPFHLTIFCEQALQRAGERAGLEVTEFKQKPAPYRYEFMEEGYTTPRLLLEAGKALLTGVRGVTLFAALRNGADSATNGRRIEAIRR